MKKKFIWRSCPERNGVMGRDLHTGRGIKPLICLAKGRQFRPSAASILGPRERAGRRNWKVESSFRESRSECWQRSNKTPMFILRGKGFSTVGNRGKLGVVGSGGLGLFELVHRRKLSHGQVQGRLSSFSEEGAQEKKKKNGMNWRKYRSKRLRTLEIPRSESLTRNRT